MATRPKATKPREAAMMVIYFFMLIIIVFVVLMPKFTRIFGKIEKGKGSL